MRIEKHPVLEFNRGREVTFSFEGRKMKAFSNETVAAALQANGVDILSRSIRHGRGRGFFCGIGRCCSCDMIINGVPNVRACITLVEDGMEVKVQEGRGSFDVAQ